MGTDGMGGKLRESRWPGSALPIYMKKISGPPNCFLGTEANTDTYRNSMEKSAVPYQRQSRPWKEQDL